MDESEDRRKRLKALSQAAGGQLAEDTGGPGAGALLCRAPHRCQLRGVSLLRGRQLRATRLHSAH